MRPRTVLITGASSGIGRALALEYAAPGVSLALLSRREDELLKLQSEVEKKGGRAVPLIVDVCEPAAVREALHRADRELGGLDMVIANAGISSTKAAPLLCFSDVQRVIDTNIVGAFATLVEAIPVMVTHGRGHLVGVSSLAGLRGLPAGAAYSASKAALSTFLDSLRVDLGPLGIFVTDVLPGYVDTPMARRPGVNLPFVWSAEKAAHVIARRLEKNPACIAFPWQTHLAMTVARLLPADVYGAIARKLAEKDPRRRTASAKASPEPAHASSMS